MSFIKRFVTRHIEAAAAMRPAGQESVAVFFYGAPPSIEDIIALAAEAHASTSVEGSKTRLKLEWPDVTLTITVDAAWDRAAQLAGLRGWMERFPARVKTQPRVQALTASLEQVAACYGTVATPGLDADNKIMDLLRNLLGAQGGFLFSRNSFYEPSGACITGYDEDPAWLGTPPADAPSAKL